MIKPKKVSKDYSDKDGRYFWILFEDSSIPILYDSKTKKVYDWLLLNLRTTIELEYKKEYNKSIIDSYIDNTDMLVGVFELGICRNRTKMLNWLSDQESLKEIEKIVIDSML